MNEGTGGFVEVASTVPSNRQGASAVFDDMTVSKFWSKVNRSPGHGPSGDCWPWTGAKSADGYGVFRAHGRRHRAHRFSLALHTNQIDMLEPVDMMDLKPNLACHSCHNEICVNPHHLRWDTAKSNKYDQIVRGTMMAGIEKATIKKLETGNFGGRPMQRTFIPTLRAKEALGND